MSCLPKWNIIIIIIDLFCSSFQKWVAEVIDKEGTMCISKANSYDII